jgi:VWFA-related protein
MNKKTPFVMAVALAACMLLTPAPGQEPVDSHTTIRTDTRLVLVDTVVTDKKGNYVRDLAQGDFKVYEDNKEQTVTSFSFESGPATADSRKHYLVLFFDNSNAGPAQQIYAREAATKFINANAGPNRLMAIAEFGGALRVTQDFTADADRLKQVVAGVKFASIGPAAGGLGGGRRMNAAFNDFSIRGVLGALRNMAKGLADVPGRKTLIFLSGGFPMTEETISELTATIDACNRANVAIYPIDIRGLLAPTGALQKGPVEMFAGLRALARTAVSPVAFLASAAGPAPTGLSGMGFQARGGGPGGGGGGNPGGGGGGGKPGGGSGTGPGSGSSGGAIHTAPGAGPGTRGNSSGSSGNSSSHSNGGGGGGGNTNNNVPSPSNRINNLRNVLPPIDTSITGMQQPLYALASGTGGFVIVNTNDLLGGLEKIGKEQNEYYLIGYAPSKEPEPGACHTLRVKVNKSGTSVRARSGYCEAKSLDILSGTRAERDLEARITGSATPTVAGASMLTPFFYISSNTARVNLALDIPAGTLQFAKEKGKFRSVMNVVGIAYLEDGSVAARFSDSVKVAFEEKKSKESFDKTPYHYEKQFEMAPGKYTLKVVFSSSADQLGRLEAPLTIEPWETQQFFISCLALSKTARPKGRGPDFDAELLDNRVPLVVDNVQILPAGSNRFKKSENSFVYLEIYEPALAAPDVAAKDVPVVAVKMELLDPQSGQVKKDFGAMRMSTPPITGNPMMPVGLVVSAPEVEAGLYRLRVTAVDSAGHQVARSTAIQLEN